jgi:hypothetical protein
METRTEAQLKVNRTTLCEISPKLPILVSVASDVMVVGLSLVTAVL